MCHRSRVCIVVLLALACLAGVSAADDYTLPPITDTNLNGVAASGEMNGNPRYFDWDTPDEPHLAWVSEDIFAANRIQLELISPRGGEICGGIHPVKWKALHDMNLTINLSYSPNYGINWIPLASNLTCDPNLTANLTENLMRNATNATNITGGDYNGVHLWNTKDLSDGEYLIRVTAQWYILEEMYTSNTVIVLNGNAASGGIGGNGRYFDWDTPDEPHLAWVSEDIFAGGSASIVVADDRVFVYCTGGGVFKPSEYTYMIALNATNGEMLWATEIAPAEYGSWASPAYHNGSVFIASGAHVYRIDGGDGAILWNYTFSDGGANCNAGPSVSGGKVFVASFTPGNMFCINEETGDELWNTSTYLESTVHLGSATPKYGRIYYGRGDEVCCLTMDDGAVVWKTNVEKDVFSTPVVVDGRCYAATYEFGQGFGGFNCLDAFNGSILWNAPVQRTSSTPAYFAPRDSDKKYVYVVGGCAGFSGYGVYCFNATNGSSIWTNEDAGSWTNSVAVSRDAKVFVGVSAGSFNYNGLKCLDAYTGDELWSSPYGGSSPYIAYGRIYTIGGNRLYAFGKRELPDLVVTAASASGGVVHATIKNNGTGGTNESFRVALRKSGSVIDCCTVDALDAGESVAVTLSPHWACGNLMVYADGGGDVPERDEYNNMRELQVPCEHPEYHDGWHQFQKDSQNTGITSDAAPRSDPELVWSAFTHTDEWGNGIDVPPIIAGALVYVYDVNGTLQAFNKTDGTLLWRNETSVGFQGSTPAYGAGKIFVASNIGDMYAFDAATGEELWKKHATDRDFKCPVTYNDHKIYVGEGLSGGVRTKYYYCYDDSGNELWKHATDDTAGFLWCGASVVENYLVYPVHEGRLISVYLENGTMRDEVDLKSDLSFSRSDLGRIRASVAYHDGYVYATSEKSQATGYVWKVGFEDGVFIDNGWSSCIGFSTSTPVIHDGRVYVGQGGHEHPSGNLTCLNDSNGELIWKYTVPKGVKSSPALSIGDDGVYAYFTTAMSGGSLYCLRDCGDSAALAWEYNPPDDGYILQGAAISDGFVYFGTDGGYVYCIGRRGDLNRDGVISAADAVIALQMAIGAVPALGVGDMNSDGGVTSLDALMILQAAAGAVNL